MRTTADLAVAAGHSVDPARWWVIFDEAMARIAGRFARVEPRRTARELLRGLLSTVERKNCWWLAEHAGHVGPQGMQRLLRTAVWDADLVRDEVRGFVVDHLGQADAVLVPDETGFLKKGTCSVGVQRQYTGTAGRVENAQVAVFLGYACETGRALIDRRIYLPASWTGDPERCRAAGVPSDVAFATKPRLALDMITQACRARVPAAGVAADEVYGNDAAFRAGLRSLGLGYVLAVARDHRVVVSNGHIRMRADAVAEALPTSAWQQRSAGVGTKGPRYYAWAWVQATTPGQPDQTLLIRRNTTTGELAFYRCWAPHPVTLAQLVRVAGLRWCIEESFQAAKSQVGLDHYQVRGWTPWHRIVTLTMLALAILTIAGAELAAPSRGADPYRHARTSNPITLTVAELRHLVATVVDPPGLSASHLLACSAWRRRHQGHARQCHYRRRLQAGST